MTFYGLPKEDRKEAMEHIDAIIQIYQKNNKKILSADNMLVAMRSASFLQELDFSDAIRQYCYDSEGDALPNNLTKFWRMHVYTWCCEQGLRIEGSLVECGVHLGLYSLIMMRTLNFANSGKEMFLYDTFEGLPEELSTDRERLQVADVYDIPDWEQTVRDSFSPYPNAHVIRGRVPEVLQDTAPDPVAFLHIDMNAAQAEIAALDFFRPRLSPGAIILLDDFGRTENHEIGRAHGIWFAQAGKKILELPTGQGMVIWN